MDSFNGFVVELSKLMDSTQGKPKRTFVVISRRYENLVPEMLQALRSQENIEVILDRRMKERRKERRSFSPERRFAARRRMKDQLAEVVYLF
jgi:hypothetical protein